MVERGSPEIDKQKRKMTTESNNEIFEDDTPKGEKSFDRQVSSIVDWNGGSSKNLLNLGVKDYIIEQWEGEEEDEVGILSFNTDNSVSPAKKKSPNKKILNNYNLSLPRVNEEPEKDNKDYSGESLNGSSDSELDKYLK
jgi:hypothetical protein